MKIAVAGTGYVGLSLATLLSVNNQVVALDIVKEKVDMINNRISPIKDNYIEKYFKEKKLDLKATLDYKEAFKDAKFIIISTPTNYNDETQYFDTSSVEDIIEKVISMNLDTTMVIKSTIPVGYVESIKAKYRINNIMFSPEFLREGSALYDNLYPSRIIVGDNNNSAKEFSELLLDSTVNKSSPVLFMNSTEAEAVKLFANTYLALRVSYFNELDTYAISKNLDSKKIIQGVSLDDRIGNYYNNPSFGYGGYCLPKDTKQLLANYKDIPQTLISAVISSNETRKDFITKEILNKNPKVVGIYRLIMKSGSDNFRFSAIQDIIKNLNYNNIKVIIYEPELTITKFKDLEVINNLEEFKNKSSIILANRLNSELDDIVYKVYTRDIFNLN